MNFIFNEHGVCINPENIQVINSNQIFVCINLASKNNLWCKGYQFLYDGGSVGCGGVTMPTTLKWNQYISRDAALESAIEELREITIKRGNHPNGTSNKRILKSLDKVLPNQLELFV